MGSTQNKCTDACPSHLRTGSDPIVAMPTKRATNNRGEIGRDPEYTHAELTTKKIGQEIFHVSDSTRSLGSCLGKTDFSSSPLVDCNDYIGSITVTMKSVMMWRK